MLGITNNLVVKLIEAINKEKKRFELLGFLSSETDRIKSLLGYPVIGTYASIPELYNQDENIFFFNNINISIPESKEVDGILDQNGCNLVSLIHPDIDLNRVEFDCNCMLCEGTVIGPNVKIGRHLTCRLQSIISHDVSIGSYVYISPGVTVCGGSNLHDGCDLGAGSTILPNITIGENSIVGAGAVVTEDIPDNVTVVGVPAKIIKQDNEYSENNKKQSV